MALDPEKIYSAMAYYRLSKNDHAAHESDSISNQRKLIQNYAAAHRDLRLVGEAYDDGYTGTNYDRPGFRAVMEAIESGKADCVIVKDLSRLGREYIETGKYLEMIFPEKGVRFIAINDDVDSDHQSSGDDILIPVKNLMNESQCRELSRKLRAQFRLQRAQGEFLGAFASYGYRKSPADRHKLVVDEYAAEIVRTIFSLKMRGCSQQSIADRLNETGVLPPSEYKKQCGLRYQSGFRSSGAPKWTAASVRRILTNPLYTGDLVQGKRGTPNYKVKKMRERRPEDWVVAKGTHEPIVDGLMFSVVQKTLQRDTRTPPAEETVQPLAGLLFCPDCGRGMCRRAVARGRKKFYYYVCSTNKRGGGCSSHTISQSRLEDAVLRAVQAQVQSAAELDALARQAADSDLLAARLKKLDLMAAQKAREMNGYEGFRMKLYEALAGGLIDRDEYQRMRKKYSQLIESAQNALDGLEAQRKELEEGPAPGRAWMEQLLRHQNITALSRETAVALIDRVLVFEDRQIRIEFNFRDEMAEARDLLEAAGKEAV